MVPGVLPPEADYDHFAWALLHVAGDIQSAGDATTGQEDEAA